MHPIYEFGSETQKEKYLPRLGMYPSKGLKVEELTRCCTIATGELVGAFVRLYLSLRVLGLTTCNILGTHGTQSRL